MGTATAAGPYTVLMRVSAPAKRTHETRRGVTGTAGDHAVVTVTVTAHQTVGGIRGCHGPATPSGSGGHRGFEGIRGGRHPRPAPVAPRCTCGCGRAAAVTSRPLLQALDRFHRPADLRRNTS